MAKHNVNVGFTSQIAGAAGISAALAVALCDFAFDVFGHPIIGGLAAGIVSWAIAKTEPGAGGGLVAVSVLGILVAIYSIAS